MEESYKVFKWFDELDTKKQIKYKDFEKFNIFLEKNEVWSYDEIFDSYLRVLSWENIDYVDYSELDFQIKYLIEEKKVAVNNILEFAELKFSDLENLLTTLLLESNLFSPINKIGDFVWINKDIEEKIPDVVKNILKEKKWNLVVIMQKPWEKQRFFHLIDFDFTKDVIKNFQTFKEKLLDFNLDEEYKKNSTLAVWIWIQ